MTEQTIATILFALGAVSSVLLPYLREWVASKQPFDWRMVIGQLLATAGTVAASIVGLVDSLGTAAPAEAFFLGWGVSSAGRFGQKVYDSVRK